MNVLLRWKMPRAYKRIIAWQNIKVFGSCIIIGLLVAWYTDQTAMADLRRFAPDEAKNYAHIVYGVAGFFPFFVTILFIRLLFPLPYTLTSRDVQEEGKIICLWRDVESYAFEPSTDMPGLRALKIKSRKRDNFYSLYFDRQEVDEAQIAQIFEEQMARHRPELLEN